MIPKKSILECKEKCDYAIRLLMNHNVNSAKYYWRYDYGQEEFWAVEEVFQLDYEINFLTRISPSEAFVKPTKNDTEE